MIQDVTVSSKVGLESAQFYPYIDLQETAGCIRDINTVYTAHEFILLYPDPW